MIERLAVIFVAAFLGDDVHETGVGAADLRGGTGMHDLKFANHRLREEQRLVARAALAAVQRIGEVEAVDGGAEIDGAAGRRRSSRNNSAAGSAPGGQLCELREIAIAIGQVCNRQPGDGVAHLRSFFVDGGRQGVAFNRGAVAGDGHVFGGPCQAELNGQVDAAAYAQA